MKALLVVAALAAPAHALRPCETDAHGWAIADAATVPLHPRLVYWADGPTKPTAKLAAKLDGKPVGVKVTLANGMALVEVLADKPGALELSGDGYDTVHYAVAAMKAPKEAHATFLRRYGSGKHHDGRGFEFEVDAQAIAFDVRWRESAQSKWQTERIPAIDRGKTQGLLIGGRFCVQNVLDRALDLGYDLEVTALLASGARVPVRDLPAHVVWTP